MNKRDRKIEICALSELKESEFRVIPIVYRQQLQSGILFRLRDRVHAYLNQCVHMPRRLNCERETIFNRERTHLRCSMHGIVYDPESGASVSTLCHGQRLQRIKLSFDQGKIYFNDKHVSEAPAQAEG